MNLVFSQHAWEDYLYWQKSDRKLIKRAKFLIQDTIRTPFKGIGKPEPLKHGLAGYWSRHISDERPLVYKVKGKAIYFAQCRCQYGVSSRITTKLTRRRKLERGTSAGCRRSGAAPCWAAVVTPRRIAVRRVGRNGQGRPAIPSVADLRSVLSLHRRSDER